MGDAIKGEMMSFLYSPHKFYYDAFSLMEYIYSMFQVIHDIWHGDYFDFMLQRLCTLFKMEV